MNRFLVDGSIYTMPKQVPNDNSDEKTKKIFEDYLDALNKFIEIYYAENIHDENIYSYSNNTNVNYYLFSNIDIDKTINEKLLLDNNVINTLREFIGKIQKARIRQLKKWILQFMRHDLICLKKEGVKKDSNHRDDIVPRKSDGIEAYYGLENQINNIEIIEYLNENIFEINGIIKILTNNIVEKNDFVEFVNIHEYKNNANVQIDDVILDAKKEYENNLEFGEYIDKSLKEYKNIVHNNIKSYEQRLFFEKLYPELIYRCLYGLNTLVEYTRKNNKGNNPNEPIWKLFNCRTIGKVEVCNKCCGYLRLLGFDCSTEDDEAEFDEECYHIHLKPITKEGISLRIYFRWDSDKIKIGYIGKHL